MSPQSLRGLVEMLTSISWLGVLAPAFLFFHKRKEPLAMTPDEERQIVRRARQQVREMRHLAIRIPEREVRQEIGEIANLANLILDAIERDPQVIGRAQRFLDYYLGTAVDLIDRYARLGEHRGHDPKIDAAVARFDELLAMVHQTFEEQHTRLLRDEALEFEIDADVLKKMMDLDGL